MVRHKSTDSVVISAVVHIILSLCTMLHSYIHNNLLNMHLHKTFYCCCPFKSRKGNPKICTGLMISGATHLS